MHPALFTTPGIRAFAEELDAERQRQIAAFGEQHHPDGTGPRKAAIVGMLCHADDAATYARSECQAAARRGETTWRLVFAEEVLEALAEEDPAKLRTELVQVAAVCAAWIADLDSRGAVEEPPAACGKCRQPFDPADTRFDGRARHGLTAYCRHCVDLCHDNNAADHRCVICA